MRTEQTDAELIAASIGRPDAFRTVFERHYDVILRYCRRRVGADGDDIASEVFLRAFDQRAKYDTERPDARPWLFGIATNLVAGARRSEARRLRAFARLGRDPQEWPDDEVNARVDATRQSPALADAIRTLGRGDRDVLLLRAWGDLNYDEIAEALAIPVGTVRSRLNRARQHVRNHLSQPPPGSDSHEGQEQWMTLS